MDTAFFEAAFFTAAGPVCGSAVPNIDRSNASAIWAEGAAIAPLKKGAEETTEEAKPFELVAA